MRYLIPLAVTLLAVLGTACSRGSDTAQRRDATLFKAQIQSLDRAKGVEQTVLDSARKTDRAIDGESR